MDFPAIGLLPVLIAENYCSLQKKVTRLQQQPIWICRWKSSSGELQVWSWSWTLQTRILLQWLGRLELWLHFSEEQVLQKKLLLVQYLEVSLLWRALSGQAGTKPPAARRCGARHERTDASSARTPAREKGSQANVQHWNFTVFKADPPKANCLHFRAVNCRQRRIKRLNFL